MACASAPPPQQEKLQFEALPHASYMAKGNSEIRGQVLLRERSAEPLRCTDAPMVATPATTYFRHVLGLAARGQMPLIGDDVDPDYRSVVRIARCDTQGHFSFVGLPAGDWYVAATVSWKVRDAFNSNLLVYRLRLNRDEMIQIVMTDRDIGMPTD